MVEISSSIKDWMLWYFTFFDEIISNQIEVVPDQCAHHLVLLYVLAIAVASRTD